MGAAKGERIGLRCAVDTNPTALRFDWEFHSVGAGESSLDVIPVGGRELSQGNLSRFLYTPTTDAEFGVSFFDIITISKSGGISHSFLF